MTNPAMQIPSDKAEAKLSGILIGMEKTAVDMHHIKQAIGYLRSEINECTKLLGQLRDVVGPSSYQYRSNYSENLTWQQVIDERMRRAASTMEQSS